MFCDRILSSIVLTFMIFSLQIADFCHIRIFEYDVKYIQDYEYDKSCTR